ncbi:beta strand repeat-containing protein [Roseateles sp. P5_E1]
MLKFDVWSRTAVRALLGGVIAAALTACGGGGGSAGTPVFDPPASTPSGAASAVAADLVVVLNKSTLTNAGSDSITATVTSIDTNRAAVGNVPVTVSVNANAVVSTSNATATNASGQLTATITQGSDTSVRPVTLTVSSGTITRAVTFNVVQQSSTNNPQANDLTLTLSASNINNSGSATITATATAVDGNRNALLGIPVQLSVTDPSAFLIAPSSTTNASGQVTGTVNIGQDRSNRTITVVATSGNLTRTAAFQVIGANFSQASPVPAVATVGAAGTVQYTLSDVNSNPMPGVTINVSGNGVTSATGTTDLNGAYTFTYTTPNAPGTNLAIKAVAGGRESLVTIPIAGGSTTVPVAGSTPVATALNLSADVVTVNTSTTNNQVTVSAIFRDGSNAPISNVRVLFAAAGDNGTGKIGSGTNSVLSDASGTASTTYAPGAVSSPTNGVTIQACWKVSDFAPGATAGSCVAAGGQLLTTTLTIVSNPVSISIGTDNTVGEGGAGLTYVKKYVVLVVDSAGNPKADVQITPSLDLGSYSKGLWEYNTAKRRWELTPQGDYAAVIDAGDYVKGALNAICPNEDLNRNGVVDGGEDVNGNKQLDPRKSDVAITLVGATKTDANGVAVLQLEYPKSLGTWVDYKITVTAAGVLSPPAYYPIGVPVSLPSKSYSALVAQGVAQGQTYAASVVDYLYTYTQLPVSAADLTSETPPAFAVSPYGTSSSCASPK